MRIRSFWIELLLHIVHRIGARAEKRINKELLDELRGVANKPRLLYQIAEAALAHPDDTIRVGIFRVLSEEQCKAIVQEYYINTLLIQQVLAEPKQFQQMKKEDLRALTPLIYSHVTPYGTFRLDLSERMLIEEEMSA